MTSEEGPTTITYQRTTRCCGLCKWHDSKLVVSGRNPVYEHHCQHPKAYPDGQKVSYNFFGNQGRFIGDDDITPDWCPVLNHLTATEPGGRTVRRCGPMNDRPEVECQHCHWQGDASELNCTIEDYNNQNALVFTRCPLCGSAWVEDMTGPPARYDDRSGGPVDLKQLLPPL